MNDGRAQIEECLSIKNTIPNVSAILFERPNIHSVLTQYSEMISSYRIAGDWLLYTLILENGKIAFSPAPLNFHRRHKRSVTLGNLNQCLVEEIRRMQLFVADRYKISAERRHAAKKYVESLGNQLGLSVSEWA